MLELLMMDGLIEDEKRRKIIKKYAFLILSCMGRAGQQDG